MVAANAFMRPDAVFTRRDPFADDSASGRYDPGAPWPLFDRSSVSMPAFSTNRMPSSPAALRRRGDSTAPALFRSS